MRKEHDGRCYGYKHYGCNCPAFLDHLPTVTEARAIVNLEWMSRA
jgi:hypothetical protein